MTTPATIGQPDGDVVAASRRASSDSNIPAPEGLDYFPYQKAGIDFASQRNTLIADEMGLGKTIQALGTANNLSADRVLIVAPPTLLGNWQREADTWLVENPPTHVVKDGKASSWNIPEAGPAVAIIGYSNLSKHRDSIREGEWDMVVLDEGHYLGNLDAQRTQEVVGCVKDACRSPKAAGEGDGITPIEADRKLVLTGTPFDAKTSQLFPLVSYLAPEQWGAPGRQAQSEFSRRYYDTTRKRGRNLDELQERLRSTVMLRRTGDDVFDQVPLGPIERRTIILDPETEAERVAINQAGNVNIPPAEADLVSDKVAFTAMSRVLRETAMAKAPQVGRYMATAAREEPVVFFSNYPDVLQTVADELDGAGVKYGIIDGSITDKGKRAQVAWDFQSGKTDAILLSLGTGKEGLTLTRSRRMIFNDLSWKPTDLMQAEKRIHRIGQKGDVLVEYMVLNHSLDGHQADVMARKIHSMAGGVGLSKSAEDLAGSKNPDEPDGDAFVEDLATPPAVATMPAGSELEQRLELCESAPSELTAARVRKFAEQDVGKARRVLESTAIRSGLPPIKDLPRNVERLALRGNGRVVAIGGDEAESEPVETGNGPTPEATPDIERARTGAGLRVLKPVPRRRPSRTPARRLKQVVASGADEPKPDAASGALGDQDVSSRPMDQGPVIGGVLCGSETPLEAPGHGGTGPRRGRVQRGAGTLPGGG